MASPSGEKIGPRPLEAGQELVPVGAARPGLKMSAPQGSHGSKRDSLIAYQHGTIFFATPLRVEIHLTKLAHSCHDIIQGPLTNFGPHRYLIILSVVMRSILAHDEMRKHGIDIFTWDSRNLFLIRLDLRSFAKNRFSVGTSLPYRHLNDAAGQANHYNLLWYRA